MSIRLEMLQVARLAPKVLDESAGLVREFLLRQQNQDGGFKDRLSGQPVRAACYAGCSRLNQQHGSLARWSMFSVAFTDLYIRLCAGGYITDWRLF